MRIGSFWPIAAGDDGRLPAKSCRCPVVSSTHFIGLEQLCSDRSHLISQLRNQAIWLSNAVDASGIHTGRIKY